ncbi:MAG TPA: sulfurtransferase [Thiotrichaceae bacterium]|jgi:rhodanese-related sulfurtransferase|nr:sulfurtransferase [Thiotrichaceae bacterium]HIM08766.1 sulfurtransferase [Gammaproteobacteria bacterium]
MKTITVVELKTTLDTGKNPVLLDVREAWEYETCHIEGSINISMSNVQKMIDELKPDDETVVICHHGMRSFQVASYLEDNGYNNITNLEGGVDAWAKSVDADMAQY